MLKLQSTGFSIFRLISKLEVLYCRYCCIVKLYVYKIPIVIKLVALYCSVVYCKSASTVTFKVLYVNKFIH